MSTAAIAPGATMSGLQTTSHHNNTTSHSDVDRLALNLSSKNPFRNCATSSSQLSPTIASPTSSDQTSQSRMSKNPFLDVAEVRNDTNTAATSPVVNVPSDIFNDLSLLDRPAAPQQKNGPPPPYAAHTGRVQPTTNSGMPPPLGPPRSQVSPRRQDVDRTRRPRGMSETSVTERERQDRRDREREHKDQPPRTESEERRRRERRKEREERHKRERERAAARKPSRRPQGLDIIDKLDVTGIYGQGLFHHDGPFDACNPHRNAKRDRKAPMQAFPANSANMQLGGSGPINTQIDLDRFHGRGEEAFGAFNNARKAETMIVDPTSRVEAIHGDETYGLGTSTFLEGAPASRRDMQRKDSEDRREELNGGGLSRKKSLAQKFRGMSSGRANRPTDLRAPDSRFDGDVFDASPPPLGPAGKSVSAGGIAYATHSKETEHNPFDNDYENAYEKKGAQIKIAEQERAVGRARAPSSPQGNARGLVRTVTSDSQDFGRPNSNEGESSKTGFLSRMKSLKGGKKRQES